MLFHEVLVHADDYVHVVRFTREYDVWVFLRSRKHACTVGWSDLSPPTFIDAPSEEVSACA